MNQDFVIKSALPSSFRRACSNGNLQEAKEILAEHGKIKHSDFHFGVGFGSALKNHHFHINDWMLTIFSDLNYKRYKTTLESILISGEFPSPATIGITEIIENPYFRKDQIAMEWIRSQFDSFTENGKKIIEMTLPPEPHEVPDDLDDDIENEDSYEVKVNIHDVLSSYCRSCILRCPFEYLVECFPNPYKFDLNMISDIIYKKAHDGKLPVTICKEEYMRPVIVKMECHKFIHDRLVSLVVPSVPNKECSQCTEEVYECVCIPPKKEPHDKCKVNKVETFSCGEWCCESCYRGVHSKNVTCNGCHIVMCVCNIKEWCGDTILCCYCADEGKSIS